MKKLFSIYKKEMLHAIFYKAVTRLAVGMTLCLLWQRFGSDGRFTLVEGPVLVCGAIFLGWAWFNYLALDGLSVHHLLEKSREQSDAEKKRRNRHSTRSIVDYADEKILSFDELEPDEKRLCSLLVNLVLGLPMVAAGFIAGAL